MSVETILTAVGILTALTNIMVQVVKKITWDKCPTNIVALVVAQALTLAYGTYYATAHNITITWPLAAGAVVCGFLVAYAAMFGYDKLREVISNAGK